MSSSGAVPAPSSNKISKKSQFLKDEDCRFEEVWESPNNHLSQAVLRERVKDGNGSTITFASRASQWADRVMDCSGTDRKGVASRLKIVTGNHHRMLVIWGATGN